MNNETLLRTVESYKEWESLIEEAKKQLEGLKKQLTDELEAREVESLTVNQYVVRNTEVSSSRFDTKSFKEKLGEELYKSFTKEVKSHRFTISA